MTYDLRLPLAIMVLWFATVPLSKGQQVTADAELALGIQAYKQAKCEEAITHFKQAVALDPSNVSPQLYLATAYAQQYVPGVDVADNNHMARQAIHEFEKVLTLHPTHDQEVISLKGVASLYFNMKEFDTAKEYHKKVVKIDPNDPETYYAVGVIDWTQVYQPRVEQRAKLKLKPDEPLINAAACWSIRAANEASVKEGMEMLTKALSIHSGDDDAMAYMNLMYRERADIQCGNRQAYDADIKTADQWVDLTIATKKGKMEAAPAKNHQE